MTVSSPLTESTTIADPVDPRVAVAEAVLALGEHLLEPCFSCREEINEGCPKGERLLNVAFDAATRVHNVDRGWRT